MLNIAGPEYDFGSVVYVVLEECEHRRRGFQDKGLDSKLMEIARAKLAQIKGAYDEFGGSPTYWTALETEVLETVMPQYIASATEMNRLEKSGFDVFRSGDISARFLFAGAGLLIGVLFMAVPFVAKIFEAMFAFITAGVGFAYPDLKRYNYDRRHAKLLNRLVQDSAKYQQTSRLHYRTTTDIRKSFELPEPSIDVTTERETE